MELHGLQIQQLLNTARQAFSFRWYYKLQLDWLFGGEILQELQDLASY
jgi:hypothetical protein